jgi:P pilus assembly chaperone PapD
MNIKAIPSTEKKEGQNTLQVAIKTRIKLIFRPASLKGTPEDVAQNLKWQRSGNSIQVTNPTPFYMNFMEIMVGGKEVKDVTWVAPMSTASFALPTGVSSGSVTWKIISDYGGVGNSHSASM